MLAWILNMNFSASSAGTPPGGGTQNGYIITGIGVMIRVLPWFALTTLLIGLDHG